MGIVMKDYKHILRSIDASLQEGQYFSGKWMALFISLIVYCSVFILTCLLWLILVKCGIESYDKGEHMSMSCCLCISVLIIIGVLYAIHRNNRLKKKILLWLDDAVLLPAKTQVSGSFRTYGHPVAETKLLVEFYYKGKKIIRESGDKTKKDHWYKRNGYFKVLSKYGNRDIRILYSPTYDQVLILKKNRLL